MICFCFCVSQPQPYRLDWNLFFSIVLENKMKKSASHSDQSALNHTRKMYRHWNKHFLDDYLSFQLSSSIKLFLCLVLITNTKAIVWEQKGCHIVGKFTMHIIKKPLRFRPILNSSICLFTLCYPSIELFDKVTHRRLIFLDASYSS